MAKNIAAVLAVVFFVAWASLVTWKAAVPGSQAGPPGKFGSVLGGGANPTGMNPLCTTGLTEASGIVCKTSGAHVRSCELFNNTTGSNAFTVLELFEIDTVAFYTSNIAELVIWAGAKTQANVSQIFTYFGRRYAQAWH